MMSSRVEAVCSSWNKKCAWNTHQLWRLEEPWLFNIKNHRVKWEQVWVWMLYIGTSVGFSSAYIFFTRPHSFHKIRFIESHRISSCATLDYSSFFCNLKSADVSMFIMPSAEQVCAPNVYWTVHHCNSWRMKNQLDVTCYFISVIMCSTCFGH